MVGRPYVPLYLVFVSDVILGGTGKKLQWSIPTEADRVWTRAVPVAAIGHANLKNSLPY